MQDANLQLADLQGAENIRPFAETLRDTGNFPLYSKDGLQTMQMNIGLACNLTCKHCHVEAGPDRTEAMSRQVMEQCLQAAVRCKIPKLDITGGAPELNPDFRWLIQEAKRLGRQIIVRTNLTILEEEGYTDLPEFFAENDVEVVCSLPYYTEKDADRMRGDGIFKTSIRVLQRLNSLGYGREGSGLTLNLVYNPGGAFLVGAQQGLEADYRRVLQSQYGITFTSLFALGNFPVGRFLAFLKRSRNFQPYMEKLAAAFNPATVENVMCRDQISVGYDGALYDCDFNQMLGLVSPAKHISAYGADSLFAREIVTANHCYACTAGSGSSCGGALE
ncbi:MAG: arsenosugar biosynthesis radical SAM protein ArsS [Clostridiales bacterium]|nr:arsenosugar biosynthesis radical SAM protein ArsS [Clostridiales bacterium]